MLVNHAAHRSLQRRRHGASRFRDIVVDEWLQFRRLILHEEAVYQKEELRLPFAEVAHELDEQAQVALLLAHDGRWRVLARSGEVDAIRRTADLHQPLGAAADRTNL